MNTATTRGATTNEGVEVALTRIVGATKGESEVTVAPQTQSENSTGGRVEGRGLVGTDGKEISSARTAVQKALDTLPGAQAKKETIPAVAMEGPTISDPYNPPTTSPPLTTTLPPQPPGGPPAKPKTVAAVMIVKNEEDSLRRCLESLKDHVDEIVIVDTGSTDKTVEIARQYTDRIFEYPWNDDFSAARNFSLLQATSDWCLQIDADEVMHPEDGHLLRKVIQGDGYDAVMVTILNEMPGGALSMFHYRRLYRRGKAKYFGIVHNQIEVAGPTTQPAIQDATGSPRVLPLRMIHFGYNMPAEGMKKKWDRSEKLLKKQIEADPHDTFAWFNLNRITRNRRNYDQAVKDGEHALALRPYQWNPGIYLMHLVDTSYCYLMQADYHNVERLCLEGIGYNEDNLDLLFTLGQSYFSRQAYEPAMAILQRWGETRERQEIKPNFDAKIIDTWMYQEYGKHIVVNCFINISFQQIQRFKIEDGKVLEAMFSVYSEKAQEGDLHAADIILKIMERRAMLLSPPKNGQIELPLAAPIMGREHGVVAPPRPKSVKGKSVEKFMAGI